MKKTLLILLILSFPFFSNASELRISAEKLNEALIKQSYVILDTPYIILDTRSTEKYEAGHISGAINFPVSLTYNNQKTNGQIVKPQNMQSLLRERGIEKESKVIVYDDGQLVDAARLFWALEVYGLNDIKILDRGYQYWLKMDFSISFETPTIQPSTYVININHQRLASKFTTQLASHNPKQYIIDARNHEAYIGKSSSAKRFGHIPTAINYPASHNFNSQESYMTLKSIDSLKSVYSNVPKKQKIIIYCAIGRISAANYFALRELNYNVANYDASWKEWGNDFSLPIEK